MDWEERGEVMEGALWRGLDKWFHQVNAICSQGQGAQAGPRAALGTLRDLGCFMPRCSRYRLPFIYILTCYSASFWAPCGPLCFAGPPSEGRSARPSPRVPLEAWRATSGKGAAPRRRCYFQDRARGAPGVRASS